MSEAVSSDHVFSEILKVLQRIEVRLDGHEEQFRDLETHTKRSPGRVGTEQSEDTITFVDGDVSVAQTKGPPQDRVDAIWSSRKGTPTNEDLTEDTKALNVPYSQWGVNQLDRFFNLELSKLLTQKLGDCWGMPDDDRLPLKFFKTNILQTNAPWGAPCDSYPTIRQPVERDLEFLCHFDEQLRKQPNNDFVVVDFDQADNTRIYRLGDDAVGLELEVEPQGSQTAPWSRLVFVALLNLSDRD